MKNKWKYFYSKCPKCPAYFKEATSLSEAHADIEQHEKEYHKGKPIGIFGQSMMKWW